MLICRENFSKSSYFYFLIVKAEYAYHQRIKYYRIIQQKVIVTLLPLLLTVSWIYRLFPTQYILRNWNYTILNLIIQKQLFKFFRRLTNSQGKKNSKAAYSTPAPINYLKGNLLYEQDGRLTPSATCLTSFNNLTLVLPFCRGRSRNGQSQNSQEGKNSPMLGLRRTKF